MSPCPKSLLALPCCDFFLQNQKVLPKDVMFNKLVLQDGELPRHPLVGFWQSLLQPKMLRESRFKVWTYWRRSLWKHLFVPRYYTVRRAPYSPYSELFHSYGPSVQWNLDVTKKRSKCFHWGYIGFHWGTKMTANARFQALRSLPDCWPLATVMLSVVERLVAGTGRNSSHTNDPG